jgi:hypothetical protein
MAGPKSDRATMAARRDRLLELLAEGKTETRAAAILREEGFPASHDSVERDVDYLAPMLREATMDNIKQMQARADKRLQDLEDDIESALINRTMSLKDRTVLALDILKSRRELRGLDEPRKTESKNLNVTVNATIQNQFLERSYGLSALQINEVFRVMDAMPRQRVSLEDCFPEQVPKKELHD